MSLFIVHISLLTLTVLALLLGHFESIEGQNNVLNIDPKPYGKSLEDWAKAYWSWEIASPEDVPQDPQTNMDMCVVGSDQQNIMIFLENPYDSTYSSKCSISSESPILVPLLVGECDPTVPEPRTKTGKIEDLWACAKNADEGLVSWEVTLDGNVLLKKVGKDQVNAHLIDKILVRNSSLFNITIPEGNQFEAEPGTYPAVVDGYYLILNPLAAGEHELIYKYIQQQRIPGADLSNVNSEARYILTVK